MKIAVSSGREGSGKTLVSTNLAVMFAEMGRHVTYVDCDVEKSNKLLALHSDIMSVDHFIFEQCIKGRIMHGRSWAVDVHSGITESENEHAASQLIAEMKKWSGKDITIFDSPSSIGFPLEETLRDIDYCVLVVPVIDDTCDWLDGVINICLSAGYRPGIVLNRNSFEAVSILGLLEYHALPVLGGIPYCDSRIERITSEGSTVVDMLPEYRGIFRDIAENILIQINSQSETSETAGRTFAGKS